MKTVLSIAGSDPSGGAGIQADLKTMALNGVYGMSVITALTAQNTTGVTAVEPVSPLFLQQQLDAVFSDIPPDGVKIGMVSAAPLIQVIARCLETHRPKHVVVDPVMLSTSGTRLLSEDALAALQEDLLPQATLITPNLPEAEVLSGQTITGEEDMVRAARDLSARYRCAVLCKGGHSPDGGANDLLCHQGKVLWFRGKRIDNPNAHGTSCTSPAPSRPTWPKVFPGRGHSPGQAISFRGTGGHAGPGPRRRTAGSHLCPHRLLCPGGGVSSAERSVPMEFRTLPRKSGPRP